MKFHISVLLITLFVSVAYGQTKKSNVLLLTGLGNKSSDHRYHAWQHPYYNTIVTAALSEVATVTVTEDFSALTDKNLAQYDIIINNSFLKEPTAQQQAAFYKFVASGKSYLALHAGLVTFGDNAQYTSFIGAKFIGHDDLKTFVCSVSDVWYEWEQREQEKPHPMVAGIEDFKTLDELYVMQGNTSDNHILARAELHPIMWWKTYGTGKVLCLTLGHGDYSMQNENFKKLLANSVAWLGGNLK